MLTAVAARDGKTAGRTKLMGRNTEHAKRIGSRDEARGSFQLLMDGQREEERGAQQKRETIAGGD